MAQTDPSRPATEGDAGGETGGGATEGERPFAVLTDGRMVMARFRTTVTPQPPSSLSDPEQTSWILTLDGRRLAVVGDDGRPAWLPIDDRWVRPGQAPLVAVADGARQLVRYDYCYAHHLGWLAGPVVLRVDPAGLAVEVTEDLRFDPD